MAQRNRLHQALDAQTNKYFVDFDLFMLLTIKKNIEYIKRKTKHTRSLIFVPLLASDDRKDTSGIPVHTVGSLKPTGGPEKR